MHRFFVSPDSFTGDAIHFTPEQSHQIARVLRLRAGDDVAVLDNSGACYRVALDGVSARGAHGRRLERLPGSGEAKLRLILFQAVLKGQKLDYVLQKGTELGIARFVLVECRRTVPVGDATSGRLRRWRQIVQEAAEQSRRSVLPEVAGPCSWAEACATVEGLGLVAYEGEAQTGLRSALDGLDGGAPISLYVGPEGGLEPVEVRIARDSGLTLVSLGPRILRAETAGVVAASVIFYHLGDLG